MKNKIITSTIILLGFSASVMAQATATATASATIISPITIVKAVDMNFGNVAVQAGTGGTVILAPAGTRTRTLGVTLPVVPGTVTAASFTIGGSGTSTFAITLPTTDLTLQGTPSGTMIVNAFTTPTPTSALVAGAATVNVGATLNVGAAQTPGTYLSTPGFDVTVNYN